MRLEPQRYESASCYAGSCGLSFGPFLIKSLMCGLIELKRELSVISIWLMATFSSS